MICFCMFGRSYFPLIYMGNIIPFMQNSMKNYVPLILCRVTDHLHISDLILKLCFYMFRRSYFPLNVVKIVPLSCKVQWKIMSLILCRVTDHLHIILMLIRWAIQALWASCLKSNRFYTKQEITKFPVFFFFISDVWWMCS